MYSSTLLLALAIIARVSAKEGPYPLIGIDHAEPESAPFPIIITPLKKKQGYIAVADSARVTNTKPRKGSQIWVNTENFNGHYLMYSPSEGPTLYAQRTEDNEMRPLLFAPPNTNPQNLLYHDSGFHVWDLRDNNVREITHGIGDVWAICNSDKLPVPNVVMSFHQSVWGPRSTEYGCRRIILGAEDPLNLVR